MHFDAEMVPFCGGVYRVRTRVTKFINETTGKMSTMKIRRHPGGGMVPVALQQLPNVLPKKHLSLVARSLAGESF